MTNKAAIYVRVSTHWQVDKDSLSVQKRELTAYCNFVLNIEEYEIFEDPGYSAKNTDRPAFQKMMDQLRTGKFSHLLVWKIDRISRNLIDFTTMYAELKSLGVTFVSKNEQFDTSSAIGEAMLKIILVFAELERKMTAERVTAVMLSRANNSQWNGGRIPYGYNYSNGIFSVNEKEFEIYKEITDLYYSGHSILDITKYLNGKELKTRSGSDWSATGIRKILVNQFYIGNYVYNVRDEQNKKMNPESEWITIKGHHEPLISEEKFAKIQSMLKNNRRGWQKAGDTYVRKNAHIFGGLCRCGQCGATYTASLDKPRENGYRPSVYGCATRRKFATKCSNKYINDTTIGSFVFTLMSNLLHSNSKITKSTKMGELSQWLTNSLPVSEVDEESLISVSENLLSAKEENLYEPFEIFSKKLGISDKSYEIKEKIKRDELALKRLQNLYLYGEETMPEKDYTIERKKIVDEIASLNLMLSEIDASTAKTDFMSQKATYLILTSYINDPSKITFEKFASACDQMVLRNFMHETISEITVLNKKVTSVKFKNGLTIRFTN